MAITWKISTGYKTARRAIGVAIVSLACGCAAMRAPETGRPRADEPPYPVLITASDEQRTRALNVWAALTGEQRIFNAPAPELQPATATVRALPPLASPLQLPRIGGDTQAGGSVAGVASDEEMRESLRRFIASAAPLLGVDSRNITLLAVTGEGSGTKRARYRDQPFPYPLRGEFGIIEIVFTPDRRVLQLSSTAIPDAERITRALANVRQQLVASDVTQPLAGRTIAFTDAAGRQQTYTGAANEFTVRELVIYPLRSANSPATLALHLAWEVSAGNDAAPLSIYVDAVTGETLAVVDRVAPPPGVSNER